MLSKYLEPFICKIKHKFWEIGATFQNNVSCTQCLAQNKVSGLDCILHQCFCKTLKCKSLNILCSLL